MNELPMFLICQTDDLKNAREIAERLVNLPSSVKPSLKWSLNVNFKYLC